MVTLKIIILHDKLYIKYMNANGPSNVKLCNQDVFRKITEFERFILSIEKGNIVSTACNGSSKGGEHFS